MGDPHFEDGANATADLFNQVLVAGGGVRGLHVWCGRVRYNGTSWEVDASHSRAGLATSALTWNGTTNALDITTDNFASLPLVFVTAVCGSATLTPKALAMSPTLICLEFYGESSGTPETVESTDMDCNLLIIGNYLT